MVLAFEFQQSLGQLVDLFHRATVSSAQTIDLILELQDPHYASEVDPFICQFLNAAEQEDVLL